MIGVALASVVLPGLARAQGNDPASQESTDMRINVTFGGMTMGVMLYDNPSARDFYTMLPLDGTIQDYSNNERTVYLPRRLTQDGSGRFGRERTGDLGLLCTSGNLAFYYAGYRYSNGLIRLGRMEEGFEPPSWTAAPQSDFQENARMRATVLHGPGDVRFEEVLEPQFLQPTDAIIRLSASCICGSDLWPYRGLQPQSASMHMGHEYCDVVAEIGSEARTVRPGQFVVGSFVLSDNTCPHCRHGFQSSCGQREFMSGAQAPYARVPLADGTLVATETMPDDDLIPACWRRRMCWAPAGSSGPAPVRRFLPHLLDLVLTRKIDPGNVFDQVLPIKDVAEGHKAMDERRAIKTLLRV